MTPQPATLQPGQMLGHYRIGEKIGEGGMGEVYKARDTRLDRDVAVKILPPAFATDNQRRSRFEREAKAVAALSHPNIMAINDFGHEHAIAFAVTELLEGEP
ncbi:MAG: protein kinase, partial [Acidobacteria bacterium]|nr:protein kinase [Acidobacteriota bacterium]